MPGQILDIATYHIAPAPGEKPLLIHLWSAPRRNPAGDGSFGAPAGVYHGPITKKEAAFFNSLRPSPFVYDIFAPTAKGQWKYLSSIIRNDNSTPYPPVVRYLHTLKSGHIFRVQTVVALVREQKFCSTRFVKTQNSSWRPNYQVCPDEDRLLRRLRTDSKRGQQPRLSH